MFSSRWCYSIVLVFSYCPYSSLRAEGKSRCGRPSLGHVGVAAWVTSVVGGGAVSHRLGLGAPPPWQRDVAIEGSQSVSPLRCYLDPCGQWQCCAVAWRLSPVSAAAPGAGLDWGGRQCCWAVGWGLHPHSSTATVLLGLQGQPCPWRTVLIVLCCFLIFHIADLILGLIYCPVESPQIFLHFS